MNNLKVSAAVADNRIDYVYEVEGPWSEAFNTANSKSWFMTMNEGENRFLVEYDVKMTGLPQSIAILPFLANVLPMAWFYDAKVYVEDVDRDFYNFLPAVKNGMINRHPSATLGVNCLRVN